jgi:SAM-dependent methyltransferase
MEGYRANTYGDRIADVYDSWHSFPDETEAATDLLATLAGDGPALELAIGTGRIALPLAERGVAVHGIDASKAMLSRLRRKPGGKRIPVTLGDFAEVGIDGRFRLVYLVFNTIFALLTQDDQLRCFRNVAAHLTDDGVFLVEAFVPDLARFERDQSTSVSHIDVDKIMLDVSRHNPATQTIDSQHVLVGADGIRLQPVRLRYAWPSELDLMAQLAGLRLRDRWAGWRGEPFTAAATSHVSVYEFRDPPATDQ